MAASFLWSSLWRRVFAWMCFPRTPTLLESLSCPIIISYASELLTYAVCKFGMKLMVSLRSSGDWIYKEWMAMELATMWRSQLRTLAVHVRPDPQNIPARADE
jgi:hypothetical protein